jgi:ferric-dicitrate binding protein FerR (iron transport regulator)
METAEFKELLNRYREGKATIEEVAWLESWYMDLGKADKVMMDEAELNEARELIWKQFAAEHQIVSIKRRLWPRIAVAAAAVAAITLGVWLYNISKTPRQSRLDVGNPGLAMNDIAPGKNGATITLGNGKVIQLSDAKSGVVIGQDLKYNDGAEILTPEELRSKTVQDDGQGGEGRAQALTATTAKGQTYQFTLPDGTKVWLNADSKLEFPSNFINSETRNVKLSGEGYFEVSKDKSHPFIVGAKNQDVTVLGTHFNISAYQDERLTTTTLVEGSVKVSAFDAVAGRRTEILKPNQQSIQTPGGGMQVRNVDVSEALDWKNGDFVFTQEPLAVIMRRVSRWYDVDVVYDKDVDQMQTFGGKVSRKRNISQVIKALQATQALKFRIEGKKVYVTN